MAKNAQIRARVDAGLKEEAEEVLDSLGLTASAAINMFYRQIVHRRAIPFDVALPGAEGEETRPATPTRTHGAGTLTYGDFPGLFWDARPEVPLDLDDPTTLARFLTRGDPETVAGVVTLREIAERLPGLPLPPETRAFWQCVLQVEP